MKREDWNNAVDWAELKPDGVFSKKGVMFAISKGNIRFYVEGITVYQPYGQFTTKIGKVEYHGDGRKALNKLLKES